MIYTFTVTLKDNTTIDYQATSLQALYEHLYYDRRRTFEMYDIRDVQLLREYTFRSFDGKTFRKRISETVYEKLANEYELFGHEKFKSLDGYIKFCLALNM